MRNLLLLHDLAAPFGGGLKPELEALLRSETEIAAQGAIPLPVTLHSAGPARQHASAAELDSEEVTVLAMASTAGTRRSTAQR
ncbi:MAG: hypothetical protein AAGF44_05890 [Pseudomonadota bacterium]